MTTRDPQRQRTGRLPHRFAGRDPAPSGERQDRPLLDAPDREAASPHCWRRAQAYGRIPLQVDTTGLTVSQVVDQVLALVDIPRSGDPSAPSRR